MKNHPHPQKRHERDSGGENPKSGFLKQQRAIMFSLLTLLASSTSMAAPPSGAFGGPEGAPPRRVQLPGGDVAAPAPAPNPAAGTSTKKKKKVEGADNDAEEEGATMTSEEVNKIIERLDKLEKEKDKADYESLTRWLAVISMLLSIGGAAITFTQRQKLEAHLHVLAGRLARAESAQNNLAGRLTSLENGPHTP